MSKSPVSWKKGLLWLAGGSTVGLGIAIWRYFASDNANDGGGDFRKVAAHLFVVDENAPTTTPTSSPEMKLARHAPKLDSRPILILYGTEYGFSQELAKRLEDEIHGLNCNLYPRVLDMEDFVLIEWDKEQLILIICSTYGDGVPPTRARDCFDYLEGSSLQLQQVQFSVLALGDKSYPHFARAGKTMDQKFEELGAKRIHPRADIDLEDYVVIDRWFQGVLSKLPNLELEVRQDYLWEKASSYQKKSSFNRSKPFYAKLIERRPLTIQDGPEDKETIHFEFDLEDSDIHYVVGDSLGVLPVNLYQDVNAIIKQLGVSAEFEVKTPSWAHDVPELLTDKSRGTLKLKEALSFYYDLKNLKVKTLQLLLKEAEKGNGTKDHLNKLKEILSDGPNKDNSLLTSYFNGREIIDVLEDFSSIKIKPDVLLDTLPQLQPRYYSISSSQKQDPRRVSITVAIVRYSTFNRSRVGVCSTYLSDRVKVGDKIPIFVNNNPDFRLPEDPAKDILMIGPGTGLAPFRAMLQERVLTDENGSNVLFFGCRLPDRDFLYKEELERYQSDNKLVLHTAFSRQKQQKVYVQHKIKENAASIWKLLEGGVHVYVCGDAQYMAGDVHRALHEIIQEYGHLDAENAEKFLADLEKMKRYQKDIWF